MRHFDVQMVGGIVLHEGRIAEMRTGEGKTLTATLPVYLNALSGKGVHVVTVNDYLAKRDAEWMGQLYDFLGLTTGVIVHGLSDVFGGGTVFAVERCLQRDDFCTTLKGWDHIHLNHDIRNAVHVADFCFFFCFLQKLNPGPDAATVYVAGFRKVYKTGRVEFGKSVV